MELQKNILSLNKNQSKEFIIKSWMTHDGAWFNHSLQELGIEKTNKINKAASKSLGMIEIKRFMKGKRFLSLMAVGVLLAATAGVLWSLCATYNRPNPTMDYVPQEVGIFDTIYSEHTEHNCRECHGNSLADRHHYTEMVLKDGTCTFCHPVDLSEPSGIRIERNCLAAGCHETYDNGWHHNTDMAASRNCVACHNPGLIGEITAFQDHEMYPPTVVTPTPFSCENCH